MARFSMPGLLPILAVVSFSLLVTGCSDDDDNPTTPSSPVTTVVVSPKAVTLDEIGEKIQFTAAALDGAGEPIDVEFDWDSSESEIVVIGDNGLAVATGGGFAEIYATAAGVTDTALVQVDSPAGPVVTWIKAGDGDWEDPANWSSGAVPGPESTVVIGLSGDYTVTINGDAVVNRLVLGNTALAAGELDKSAKAGNQVLKTGTNNLTVSNGNLLPGAGLVIQGQVDILDSVQWSGGTITGSGKLSIAETGELNLTGVSDLRCDADLVNAGTLAFDSPVRLVLVGNRFDVSPAGTVDFRASGTLALNSEALMICEGKILKSLGEFTAFIYASAGGFASRGTVYVLGGVLEVSSASHMGGTVDIAEGALLRLTGDTGLTTETVSVGEGFWEITGGCRLVGVRGNILTLDNVIFDASTLRPVFSGEPSLYISGTLIWRGGRVDAGGLMSMMSSSTLRFETSGTKELVNTRLIIYGSIFGDSDLDLRMAAGASMEMGSTSFAVLWTQSSGGTISQGVGDPCLVSFKNGEFRKEGAGAFNIEPRFVGNGRLTLLDGAIVGKGEFLLNEGSLVTGGGIENPGANVRLILIDSPSAQLNGTIRPGVEGQLMHMGIQGNVSLGSTFRVELDVPLEGDILAESLNFQTGGQALAGTLEVRVGRPTEPGDSVRVVRTTQGTGKFDAILGAEPFTVVTEDEDGVLMARPN